jgi:predicted TIM-barrel fold metal-dependent hydrolase
MAQYLSKRWQRYVAEVGLRSTSTMWEIPPIRAGANRLDSVPPGGGPPGSDPDFAREQLLDEWDLDAAVLNNLGSLLFATGNSPAHLEVEIARACNEWTRDYWLDADPRWHASIATSYDEPEAAVREIIRARETSDRFLQVLVGSRMERPLGNPKYWPILEAAASLSLPVAIHVGASRRSTNVPISRPTFYFEDHANYPTHNLSHVASLIFEGVFDRWPDLKIVLVELGSAWAVPFAWRLDASWHVLRDEVPDLERKPSEYFREHFWLTTQPIEEPERPEQFQDLLAQWRNFGLADRVMFATDYPHWDFDSPAEALPGWLSRDVKRRIFAGNASALYGIETRESVTRTQHA